MFYIAYMDSNDIDLVIIGDRLPTREAARAELCRLRSSSDGETRFAPEDCIILEVPVYRTRFRIDYRDRHSNAKWVRVPVDGKQYWDSITAARIALRKLRQRPLATYGRRIDPESFMI